MTPKSPAIPTAIALTLGLAVGLYPLLRGGQVLFFPEPAPEVALYDVHAGYFWRVLTCAYAAGLFAPVSFWAARAAPNRTARVVSLVVPAAALLLAVQATLLP